MPAPRNLEHAVWCILQVQPKLGANKMVAEAKTRFPELLEGGVTVRAKEVRAAIALVNSKGRAAFEDLPATTAMNGSGRDAPEPGPESELELEPTPEPMACTPEPEPTPEPCTPEPEPMPELELEPEPEPQSEPEPEPEKSAGPRMARRLSLPAVTLSEKMGSNFEPILPRPTGGRAGGDSPSRTSPGASPGMERTRR
jgi:hypothetical protein